VGDVGDDVVPVEGLLLGLRQLLQFAVEVVEFGDEFLSAELQFTQSYNLRLIGLQQAVTLPFHATFALQELFVLGGERGQIVLFALDPALVQLRQERRCA
jgi:hypothetical protein